MKAVVLQERYTAHPALPDETVRAPQELRRQCEAYKQAVLEPQLALARQAVAQGVDLLVFREDCNGAGNYCHRIDRPELFETLAEPIPGPTSQQLAEIARLGGCYVVGCFNELLDGRIYNTALLLDPSGKPVGKYHKTHLPPLERFIVTPGSSLPVFDTEIGKIGMLICYDMMTPEVCRCLALQGADVLCWPSLGYGWWTESGDFTVRSRAHDNQVSILGALPANSCIVDPYGDFLTRAGDESTAILRADLQPGTDPLQDPLHHNTYLTQTPSLRERHLFERRPDLYNVLTQPVPPLADRYPETHMHDIEQDPQGTFQRYRQAQGTLTWQSRPDRQTVP
jgi:predicted amidohydrolase